MNKLYAYLEKIGADYAREKCGDHYFFNVPGVEFDIAVVSFDFCDFETVARWHAIEKRIEKYAARYGYTIYNRSGCLGSAWFFVARSADLEKYRDYRLFMDAAVSECEKIAHDHYTGRHVVADLNTEMRRVMDEYGNNYNLFLAALAA